MNVPIQIVAPNFQLAWANAISRLKENHWSVWNLVVQIENPCECDLDFHALLTSFAKQNNLITPKQVAFTIFPYTYYNHSNSKEELYQKYWRFFRYTRKKAHRGWGTYFERMIRYNPYGREGEEVDQLSTVIDGIKSRSRNYGASYVMIIPYPQRDGRRQMGAPCLNYITVQVEQGPTGLQTNLLAVYRNHDFLERAYGNYFGLCELLKYISQESGTCVGKVTCVSSHAFVARRKGELFRVAGVIKEGAKE